jgi:ribosomal protein S18 acetylase RimI-like enzyme
MEYRIISGKELDDWIDILGQIRIETFCHFPYLYAGTIESERKYVRAFIHTPLAFLCVAYSNGELAGLITASPLQSEKSIAKKSPAAVFTEAGLNPSEYCYLGEVIVLPAFRHQGIGPELMRLAEQEAKQRKFKQTCFLCVQRSLDHPQQPHAYTPPDCIWERLGYLKTTMQIHFEWNTIDAKGLDNLQEHCMVFWISSFS